MQKRSEIVLIIAVILIFLARIFYAAYFDYKMEIENTDNIKIQGNTIYLDSLTLRQKLAQMIMIRGDNENEDLTEFGIGGVFFDRQKTEEAYKEKINNYKKNSKIKLFVSTDLEGAWNPFSDFRDFAKNKDVQDKEKAGETGTEHGELLSSLGFNMNFAPVSEYEDKVYGGRAFSGSKEEIKEKLRAYIGGLQEKVIGVCKHYPGKGMIKNLHLRKDSEEIRKEDLELFEICFDNRIKAVIVGHQIVKGEINSHKKPGSVSKEAIKNLPEEILVVSDEVNMLGLRIFYLFNKRKMYQDLINSGNNLILDFRLDKRSAYRLLTQLEQDVEEGKINEDKIDKSVKKILKLKGYQVR
jgi:beta-glucosidase-like glycosyl hydrolase